MKTFLIICGIVFGLGIILSVAGIALGGITQMEKIEEKVPWINFGESGSIETKEWDVKDASSVDVDMSCGDVTILQGDTFRVETTFDKEEVPQVSSENGKLIIVGGNEKNHPSIDLDVFEAAGNERRAVKIYIPKGKKFDKVNISSQLGDIALNGVTIKNLTINNSDGNASLNKIIADKVDIESEWGDIEGNNLQSKGLAINSSCGDIELTGTFRGKTKITNELGDIDIETTISKAQYSIDTNTDLDLGNCTIDNQSQSGRFIDRNAKAKNMLELGCSEGDMEVSFK